VSLSVRWIPLRVAIAFVRQHHRHRPRVAGGIVAVGAFEGAALVGVGILGRGARMDPPDVAEVTRVATDGTPHACSAIYARLRRVAQSLGFRALKTFTLPNEPGSSLRAAGATADGFTRGEEWDRPSRARPPGDARPKRRWWL
jgi:hypothetical protein